MEKSTFICAVGWHGGYVLSTDDESISSDMNDVSCDMDELGIRYPERVGLYRWAGRIKIVEIIGELGSVNGWEPEYHGEFTLLYEPPTLAPKVEKELYSEHVQDMLGSL